MAASMTFNTAAWPQRISVASRQRAKIGWAASCNTASRSCKKQRPANHVAPTGSASLLRAAEKHSLEKRHQPAWHRKKKRPALRHGASLAQRGGGVPAAKKKQKRRISASA